MHGVAFRLDVADEGVRERLRGDFRYFEASPSAAPLRLSVAVGRPDVSSGRASLRRPGWAAYDDGDRRHIDYAGAASARWDYARGEGAVVAATPELARELAHLAVLSRAGEALDARGLHRVHALGVAHESRGALVLMGSGGGKSVLGLELLRSTRLGLLSDDTPLLDAAGGLRPFPLPLGLRSRELARGVPEGFLSDFPRRGRETKTVVDPAFFAERVSPRAELTALLLGRRRPGSPPRLRRISRARALAALIDGLVVGRGVAQMSEYVLRPRAAHLALWAGIAASRLRAAAAAAWSVPAYDFQLSGDAAADARALERLLAG